MRTSETLWTRVERAGAAAFRETWRLSAALTGAAPGAARRALYLSHARAAFTCALTPDHSLSVLRERSRGEADWLQTAVALPFGLFADALAACWWGATGAASAARAARERVREERAALDHRAEVKWREAIASPFFD